MFICLFADVPGELIFGSLVDASCTFWSSGGSCSLYNTANLRIGLFGVAAIARYASVNYFEMIYIQHFLAVVWLLYSIGSCGMGSKD